MPRPKSSAESQRLRSGSAVPGVSLKILAEHLGLSKAAVSLVINRSPSAKSIPRHTQERIRAAARELNYRPNFMARSLRRQRSFTIGVVVPEICGGLDCSGYRVRVGLGRTGCGGFRTPGYSRRHEHHSESFLCSEISSRTPDQTWPLADRFH